MSSVPLRLAIIGCGAITEQGHLPAAAGVRGVQLVALVDKNLARAQSLAAKHPDVRAFDDYRPLIEAIDAAIVALPPSLHAPVSIELLERGVHVLVEKPMARNLSECDAMIAAAQRGGATLAVGLVRRFRWAYRWMKQLIANGTLGTITSFDVREGGVFDWPVASPFFLRKEAAGGGVFADAGVHVIDALQWWFGDVESFDYRDDDLGGVEADCELDVVMTGGLRGHIELSRTRRMRNSTMVRGEHGTAEIAAYTNDVSLSLNGDGPHAWQLRSQLQQAQGESSAASETIFADQLAEFAGAIREKRSPAVDGRAGRSSVAVVEACYAARKPLRHPWVFEGVSDPLGATDKDCSQALPVMSGHSCPH